MRWGAERVGKAEVTVAAEVMEVAEAVGTAVAMAEAVGEVGDEAKA
jgi:hypothetical protein